MILGVHKFLLVFFLFFSFPIYSEPFEVEIAEIQILNKITTKVKTYDILKNTNLNIDSLNIEIYACFKSSPEEIPEDYVLLKIYDQVNPKNDQLIYKGWMISSSPAITPFEHPIYDLWLSSCKIESDF